MRRRELSQSPLFHQKRQINEAIGEAPFVVIPGEDLDVLATDDQGRKAVNYGRTRVSLVVARYQGFVTDFDQVAPLYRPPPNLAIVGDGMHDIYRSFYANWRQVETGGDAGRSPNRSILNIDRAMNS